MLSSWSQSFLNLLYNLEKFFDFHNFSDSHRICHTNMSFVDSARCYTKLFLRNIDLLGQCPITMCGEMKQLVSNKYVMCIVEFIC